MLYNIVDRIYIGHIPDIGADALTGVGVCMPLIMIVSAFSIISVFTFETSTPVSIMVVHTSISVSYTHLIKAAFEKDARKAFGKTIMKWEI